MGETKIRKWQSRSNVIYLLNIYINIQYIDQLSAILLALNAVGYKRNETTSNNNKICNRKENIHIHPIQLVQRSAHSHSPAAYAYEYCSESYLGDDYSCAALMHMAAWYRVVPACRIMHGPKHTHTPDLLMHRNWFGLNRTPLQHTITSI